MVVGAAWLQWWKVAVLGPVRPLGVVVDVAVVAELLCRGRGSLRSVERARRHWLLC
jgi:hypothetical protein